ncbi:MAG: TetR family transcriptional regulator [Bacteroidota bacterium]|uniref:TetR family transcriptional regulator n=1 Tax=Leeuwenhoekiella palythoae TaxID=573501 RepID=UPI000C3637E6|nr:TetR family transcriptional regulator [Leeuwenhoekiella palythoae]MAS20680.1 TetR family transcriptional regulator [Leeuwenhoekiella sp.]MEC7781796.1 TetR family transcriptional regulator [Bacteroidota bacterium]MBH13203.1 TetR family transcriptional regulator [Leeuwenhoekiella sp.]MEC8885493.1 TetR family transcriptional regulator [Bacteroidota bacterium]UBZ10648.1 TetR family transcriptional regulator [Leeuwenhoekiella palythoae]|tara:strand:- start:649 stop:1272 length:624 start_codon:yes stop_codon:yes gene_type:complete
MELNDKQKEIVQVAEKLFAEYGFDGTSVRLIAKEAGINIAMISYYFGSKEKLLEHMVVHRMSGFKVNLDEIIAQDDRSYPDRLNEIVALYVKRIHKNNRIYKIVHNELTNNARSLTFEHYLSQKKKNLDSVTKFIEAGQKAHVFKKHIEIPLLIPSILGTYFHFHYNQRFYEESYGLNTPESKELFIETTLTKHIQKMLNALITYED